MRGTDSASRTSGRPSVEAPRGRWAWAVPPVVAILVMFAAPFGLMDQLLGMALAVPLVVVAARRPGGALLTLAVFLPLQKYLVAVFYRVGFPLAAVRGLGWLKEALVLGIVLAGIHAARKAGRRPDVVDRVALLWVGGLTLYLLFPQILSAAGAPTSLNIRVQGFRANAVFALLFLGVRHAPMPVGLTGAFRRVLIAVAGLVAALGVYQFIDPQGWVRFTYDVVQVPTYQLEVLGHTPRHVYDQFLWLFETPVRVGSVLITPPEFVNLVLIGLALALSRLVRHGRHVPTGIVCAVMAFALVSSRTRATLIAAGLVGVLLLRPEAGRSSKARIRIATLAVVGIALVAPFQVGTRITGDEGGSVSTRGHIEEITTGLRHLIEEPAGRGLGTAPGVGTRFEIESTFVSDNSYLQVGNEVGAVMMVLFVALLVTVMRALRAVPPADVEAELAQALWAAGIGLMFVGLLHHVWLSFAVAWLFFAGAGLALPAGRPPDPLADRHIRR